MSSIAAEGSGSAGRPGHEARSGRVVGAAAGVTVSRLTSRSGSQRAANTATTTATVQPTNQAETTPLNGTVGLEGPVAGGPRPLSIVQPAGTTLSALDEDQQSVTSASTCGRGPRTWVRQPVRGPGLQCPRAGSGPRPTLITVCAPRTRSSVRWPSSRSMAPPQARPASGRWRTRRDRAWPCPRAEAYPSSDRCPGASG
jgi:hypothetical protein